MNDFDEKYMKAIFALHDEHMRLDSRDDAEVRLWHVIRSMLEYCRANNISFEGIVADAKEDMETAA